MCLGVIWIAENVLALVLVLSHDPDPGGELVHEAGPGATGELDVLAAGPDLGDGHQDQG